MKAAVSCSNSCICQLLPSNYDLDLSANGMPDSHHVVLSIALSELCPVALA